MRNLIVIVIFRTRCLLPLCLICNVREQWIVEFISYMERIHGNRGKLTKEAEAGARQLPAGIVCLALWT